MQTIILLHFFLRDHPLFPLNVAGLCWGDGCHLTWHRDLPTKQALHETSLRYQAVPVAWEKCPQPISVQLISVVCPDLSPAPRSRDSAKASGRIHFCGLKSSFATALLCCTPSFLLRSNNTLNVSSLLLLEQWIYSVTGLLPMSGVRVFTPARSCSWQ